jgi:hypothetical protein
VQTYILLVTTGISYTIVETHLNRSLYQPFSSQLIVRRQVDTHLPMICDRNDQIQVIVSKTKMYTRFSSRVLQITKCENLLNAISIVDNCCPVFERLENQVEAE